MRGWVPWQLLLIPNAAHYPQLVECWKQEHQALLRAHKVQQSGIARDIEERLAEVHVLRHAAPVCVVQEPRAKVVVEGRNGLVLLGRARGRTGRC